MIVNDSSSISGCIIIIHQPEIRSFQDDAALALPILDTLQKMTNSLLVSRYSYWYQKTKGLKYPCKIDLVTSNKHWWRRDDVFIIQPGIWVEPEFFGWRIRTTVETTNQLSLANTIATPFAICDGYFMEPSHLIINHHKISAVLMLPHDGCLVKNTVNDNGTMEHTHTLVSMIVVHMFHAIPIFVLNLKQSWKWNSQNNCFHCVPIIFRF